MNEAEKTVEAIHALAKVEKHILNLHNERDALRAALLAIRNHITEAAAYLETVAWVQATVDAVVKDA